MRRWGFTAAAGVVFVALLITYALVTRPSREGPDALAPTVLDIPADRVRRLAIQPAAGPAVVLEKEDRHWQLVEPKRLPTSDAAVEDLLARLSPLKARRVVAESASDLAEYGLAPPRAQLTVSLDDGQTHRLMIGAESPLGAGVKTYYLIAEGSPRVFTVSGVFAERVTGSADTFRERQLVKVGPEQVRRVRLTRGSTVIEAVAVEAGDAPAMGRLWRLRVPFDAPADADSVESLLRDLEFLRVEEFVDDDPTAEALGRYGLSQPVAAVELEWGSGEADALTLEVGGQRPSERGPGFAPGLYVRVRGQPFVYTASSMDLERVFGAQPQQWIRRSLVGLARGRVRRLSLSMAGRSGPVTLEERSGRWHLEPAGGEVPGSEVDTFLQTLSKLTGLSVQPLGDGRDGGGGWPGGVAPHIELTLSGSDGSTMAHLVVEGPGAGAGSAPATRRVLVEEGADRLLYTVDSSSLEELEAAIIRWTAPRAADSSGQVSTAGSKR